MVLPRTETFFDFEVNDSLGCCLSIENLGFSDFQFRGLSSDLAHLLISEVHQGHELRSTLDTSYRLPMEESS